MKITKEWLTERNACSEGIEWFNRQEETGGVKVIKKLLEEDNWDWANWAICRMFNRENRIRYAAYAAEQVLDIFEKKFPEDKRPRETIATARRCINNPSEENRAAAYAAYTASYASYTAYASYTVYAAYAAADAAATATATAADAAAAYAAAADATDADAMKTKIIKYGISLLEEEIKRRNRKEITIALLPVKQAMINWWSDEKKTKKS